MKQSSREVGSLKKNSLQPNLILIKLKKSVSLQLSCQPFKFSFCFWLTSKPANLRGLIFLYAWRHQKIQMSSSLKTFKIMKTINRHQFSMLLLISFPTWFLTLLFYFHSTMKMTSKKRLTTTLSAIRTSLMTLAKMMKISITEIATGECFCWKIQSVENFENWQNLDTKKYKIYGVPKPRERS